jgi:predicted nucleic acid-binding protein
VEWLTQLRGLIVGLDTAPLIYFIEENPAYIAIVDAFFQSLDLGEFRVVTSSITLTEVLVHPLRRRNPDLAQQYRDILLHQTSLTTISTSPAIAERAAHLRAIHNLRTPDAIQMATAINEGASFFLTNDTQLQVVSELEVLVLNAL